MNPEESDTFGTTHNLSYTYLVSIALNDARKAFVAGDNLHRHVLSLYTLAYPLAKERKEDEWVRAWTKLKKIGDSKGVTTELRYRQLSLLTDLFWKHGILSERGIPRFELPAVQQDDD